jgi:DNA-binding MarR family transcriptional regulator
VEQGATSGLEQEVYRLISDAFIQLDTCDQQLMRRFGLTVTQSWALVHLEDPEGRSLSELARLLICDKSNVTGIVDKLEEAGLAVRKRGKAGDRRYTRVVLTAQGQRLRLIVILAREHMIEARLGVLKEHDLLQLHDSLQQLTETLHSQFEADEIPQIIENAVEHSRPAAASILEHEELITD